MRGPVEGYSCKCYEQRDTFRQQNISTDATLQINRKLNDKGRNITFRGRFGYGDNDNNQYTESTTRYYQIPYEPDSTLVRNQYITTPTSNYNYSAQITYS